MFLETSGPGAQSTQVCVRLQRAPALLGSRDSGAHCSRHFALRGSGGQVGGLRAGRRSCQMLPPPALLGRERQGVLSCGCPPVWITAMCIWKTKQCSSTWGGGQAALGRQPLGTAARCLFAHEPTHNPHGQAGSGHVGGSDELRELPLWRPWCAGLAWLQGRPLTCLSFLPGSPP